MHACPLQSDPARCFATYQDSLLAKRNRHSWESIGPCQGCKSARINAELAHVPEADPVAGAVRPEGNRRGPLPLSACGRGHSRAVYGRKRLNGHNAGRYSCRECERINLANRLKAQKKFCADCGKPVSITAKKCLPCRVKDMTSKKVKRRKAA